MKRPKCVQCGRTFRSPDAGKFKIVRFKLTEEQREFNEQKKREGASFHPRGHLWFCEKHYEQASELKKLTSVEALEQLEENTEGDIDGNIDEKREGDTDPSKF